MQVKELMTTDPVSIDADTSTVSDAMARMREVDVHQIPAISGKKYVGMLNYREILRRRSLKLSAKVDTFIINTPEISPEEDIMEVIRLMMDTGLSAFPVLRKKSLIGIISRSDIIARLSDISEAGNIRNRQIMSSSPVTVTEDEDVDSAAAKMRGLDEIEIPVIDGESRLTGILRLDDIAADTFKRQKESIRGNYRNTGDVGGNKIKVEITSRSLMDNPASVRGEDLITETARLLNDRRLHIVPVVNDMMEVEGVVGIFDILNALARTREEQGMLILVTGLDPDDRDLYEVTYAMAAKFLIRFSKITGLSNGKLTIQVIKYQSEGRTKYSVRTRIVAEPLIMSIDHHDWNYGKCLSFIFDTYEPRLRRWKNK